MFDIYTYDIITEMTTINPIYLDSHLTTFNVDGYEEALIQFDADNLWIKSKNCDFYAPRSELNFGKVVTEMPTNLPHNGFEQVAMQTVDTGLFFFESKEAMVSFKLYVPSKKDRIKVVASVAALLIGVFLLIFLVNDIDQLLVYLVFFVFGIAGPMVISFQKKINKKQTSTPQFKKLHKNFEMKPSRPMWNHETLSTGFYDGE